MILGPVIQSIAGQLLQPMLAIVAAGITYACAKAVRWLETKTKNEAARHALDRLNDAINVSVGDVEQSIVKAYKAGAPDGKLSMDAAKIVKAAAISAVKNQIGEVGIASAKKVLGVDDMEAAISSRVEAAVSKL